jgi:tRNA dimethylallyltransferase
MKKIIVLTGQTATGKTKQAIKYAHQYNGEIINCDARQIYKQLNVITGKDLELTDGTFNFKKQLHNFDIGWYTLEDTYIPLWLYDIVKPDTNFSAFDYRECALSVIDDIVKKEKTPIIVGGSFFYLKQLLYGTIQTNVEPDEKLRAELSSKTVIELQSILNDLDKIKLENMNHSDRNNPHRLIRQIEINKGDPHEVIRQSLQEIYPDVSIEIHGFYYESKDKLKKMIMQRVEKRLQEGALQEVEGLLALGYTEDDPGLQTIGYKEILAYLNHEYAFEKMKEEWITKELQYAKRQLTFMRQNKDIHWQSIG